MRCPTCRREIAFEAMSCKFCGWKAVVSVPVTAAEAAQPRKKLERAMPLPPEIRAALDKALAKHRVKPEQRREPLTAAVAGEGEVTPGHGRACYCELCWAKKMDPIRRRMPSDQA